MSTVRSYATLNSRCSLNKNKKQFIPSKKTVLKDQIVSSRFVNVKQFIPSYMKTELQPEINSLITMEYAKIWQDEHKLYERNVIEEMLVEKKRFKPPQTKCFPTAIKCANIPLSTSRPPPPARKKIQRELKNAKELVKLQNPKPKPVWK